MKIRQDSTRLAGIRDDHKERYYYAADFIKEIGAKTVIDAACGVGYGSNIMARETAVKIHAFDRDLGSIFRAGDYYNFRNRVQFWCMNFEEFPGTECDRFPVDLVVAFECLEHAPESFDFLKNVNAKYLICSVPNELVVPFVQGKSNPEHYRHFTMSQLNEKLYNVDWRVTEMSSQYGKTGDAAKVIKGDSTGRTLVFKAERI